ncbi:MAG: hypothetical protein RQM92_08385 [Candidatus Syntrophopropionicum ammoniitolerans]
MRKKIIRDISNPERKKKKLEDLVSDEILNMLKKGGFDPAKEMLLSAYNGSRS